MASRKDYVATANAIRKLKNQKDRARMTISMEKIYSNDNPKFNKEIFRKSCGYYHIKKGMKGTYKDNFFLDLITLKHV